jgi:hypothetical protein
MDKKVASKYTYEISPAFFTLQSRHKKREDPRICGLVLK